MTVPPLHRWAQTSSCSCGRSPFSSAADPSRPSSSFPEPVSQTSAVRALWWNHAIGSVSAGACGAKPVKHQSQNKECLLLKLQVYAKVVIKSGHGATSFKCNPLISQSSDLLLIPVPLYLCLLCFKPSILHQHLYLFFSQTSLFLHLNLQSFHLSNKLVTTIFRITKTTVSERRG